MKKIYTILFVLFLSAISLQSIAGNFFKNVINSSKLGAIKNDWILDFSKLDSVFSCTIDAGNNVSICSGNSTTLTATGGDSYSWSTGGTTTSVTVNPTATSTYTVTGYCSGTSATDFVVVTVNSNPTVDAGSNVNKCHGTTSALIATASGNGPFTYSWSNNSTSETATTQTINVDPNITTTYTVTVTDGNGCTATDWVKVTVINPYVWAGTDKNICVGGQTSIDAILGYNFYNNQVSDFNYSWSPSTGLSATNILAPTANPTSTTSYSVTVTSKSSGTCSATDGVKITVNSLPTASAGNDQTICSGNNVTLTATGGGTYSWSTGETTASITKTPSATTTYIVTVTNASSCTASSQVVVTVNSLPTITVNSPTICNGASATLTASGGTTYSWTTTETSNPITVSPTSTTTYRVTGTTSGCAGTAQATVTVNSNPTVTVNSPTICNGASATLTASGGTSYLWTTTETSNPITVSPTSTTTYMVTGTTAGCSGTAQATVTVNSNPTVTVNSPTICNGSSATLTASGGTTYSWTTSETTNPITVTPTSTTTYKVTGTTSGCTGTVQATVTVNTLPTVDAGSNVNKCHGTTSALTATASGNGPFTYSWSNNSTSEKATTQTINVDPNITTTYTVIVTDGNGCTATDWVKVTVINPYVWAGSDKNICVGGQTSIDAVLGYNFYNNQVSDFNYSWSPSTGLSATNILAPTANPTNTTSYTITATSKNNSTCSATCEVFISVPHPAQTESFVCYGVPFALSACNETCFTYTWSSGESTRLQNIHSITTTTTYTVTIGLDASNSCTYSIKTDAINPTVNMSASPSAVCNGSNTQLSATLTTTPPNGVTPTYTWTPTNNLSASNIYNPTATPTSSTTYTVTTQVWQCTSTNNLAVTVNSVPTVTAGSDQTICSGVTQGLTASGATTYSWSTGETSASINVSPTTTTTYNVTGTTSGCTGTAQTIVTVNSVPTVTAGTAQTICSGNKAILTASGATTYSWSNGLTVNPDTVIPTTTSTYYVTGTSSGCVGTSSVVVTVKPTPVVSATSSTICSGVSTTLVASGGTTYSWSNGKTTYNNTVNPTITTTYKVSGTTNGCTGTVIDSVFVNCFAPISCTPNTTDSCELISNKHFIYNTTTLSTTLSAIQNQSCWAPVVSSVGTWVYILTPGKRISQCGSNCPDSCSTSYYNCMTSPTCTTTTCRNDCNTNIRLSTGCSTSTCLSNVACYNQVVMWGLNNNIPYPEYLNMNSYKCSYLTQHHSPLLENGNDTLQYLSHILIANNTIGDGVYAKLAKSISRKEGEYYKLKFSIYIQPAISISSGLHAYSNGFAIHPDNSRAYLEVGLSQNSISFNKMTYYIPNYRFYDHGGQKIPYTYTDRTRNCDQWLYVTSCKNAPTDKSAYGIYSTTAPKITEHPTDIEQYYNVNSGAIAKIDSTGLYFHVANPAWETVEVPFQPNSTSGNYNYLLISARSHWKYNNSKYEILNCDAAEYMALKNVSIRKIYFKPTITQNATICSGITHNISVTQSANINDEGARFSYLWSTGDTTSSISVKPTLTTTYIVTVNRLDLNASSTLASVVNVYPVITPSFDFDTTKMVGDTIHFINNTGGTGSLSYVWDFGDGQSSTLYNPSHLYVSIGLKNIVLTISDNFGCNVTISKVFNVKESQILNIRRLQTIGGTNDEEIKGMFCDDKQNVIIAGNYKSSNLYLSSTNLNIANSGGKDIFILKTDTAGNILWSNSIRGKANEEVYSIERDNSNNIYIAGYTNSDTLKIENSDYLNILPQSIFLAKFDSVGTFKWIRYIADPVNSKISDLSMTINSTGMIFIGGNIKGDTLICEAEFQVFKDTINSVFIARFDTSGAFYWLSKIEDSLGISINHIKTDINSNIYLSGNYTGDISIDDNKLNVQSKNDKTDGFILKLNEIGKPVYFDRIGGINDDNVINYDINLTGSGIFGLNYENCSIDITKFNFTDYVNTSSTMVNINVPNSSSKGSMLINIDENNNLSGVTTLISSNLNIDNVSINLNGNGSVIGSVEGNTLTISTYKYANNIFTEIYKTISNNINYNKYLFKLNESGIVSGRFLLNKVSDTVKYTILNTNHGNNTIIFGDFSSQISISNTDVTSKGLKDILSIKINDGNTTAITKRVKINACNNEIISLIPEFSTPHDYILWNDKTTTGSKSIAVNKSETYVCSAYKIIDNKIINTETYVYDVSMIKVNADAGDDRTICKNDKVLLSVSVIPTANTTLAYSWSDGVTDNKTSISGKSISDESREYYITVTKTSGIKQCTAIDTVNITVINDATCLPSFAGLERELTSNIYELSDDSLYFMYNEEYYITSGTGKVDFTIIKEDDTQEKISDNILRSYYKNDPQNVFPETGNNYYAMGCSGLQEGYYILRAINVKGEKSYLRFRKENNNN